MTTARAKQKSSRLQISRSNNLGCITNKNASVSRGVFLCSISVKSADKPDSVHSGCPLRDRHYSGLGVAPPARCYLPAHSGGPVNVCLLGIAARRDCPFHPVRSTLAGTPDRLVSVALILTSRWTAVSCYAALCSPDVPPVLCFHNCTSDSLANFTGWIIADKRHCHQ